MDWNDLLDGFVEDEVICYLSSKDPGEVRMRTGRGYRDEHVI